MVVTNYLPKYNYILVPSLFDGSILRIHCYAMGHGQGTPENYVYIFYIIFLNENYRVYLMDLFSVYTVMPWGMVRALLRIMYILSISSF